jgi:hypothetical protein
LSLIVFDLGRLRPNCKRRFIPHLAGAGMDLR